MLPPEYFKPRSTVVCQPAVLAAIFPSLREHISASDPHTVSHVFGVQVRSISRVPEPFPAAHSSPTSLGASDLATGPRCDGDVDTNQTRPPPDERQTDTSRQRSMHCAVHTTQAPLNSGKHARMADV